MISPKLITQGDFQTVNGYAGTGPYVYDEYVAGQYTTFVRNENYWGEQPYYDKIVAKYIPDNASRVQALQTGEIDQAVHARCDGRRRPESTGPAPETV